MNNVGEQFVDDGTYFPGAVLGRGKYLREWRRPGEVIFVDTVTNKIEDHVVLKSDTHEREIYARMVSKLMEAGNGK